MGAGADVALYRAAFALLRDPGAWLVGTTLAACARY